MFAAGEVENEAPVIPLPCALWAKKMVNLKPIYHFLTLCCVRGNVSNICKSYVGISEQNFYSLQLLYYHTVYSQWDSYWEHLCEIITNYIQLGKKHKIIYITKNNLFLKTALFLTFNTHYNSYLALNGLLSQLAFKKLQCQKANFIQTLPYINSDFNRVSLAT